MTLAKGSTAQLKHDELTTWHNVLGYPQVTVTENTRVWIVSGPNPYVSRLGRFYLVETEYGKPESIVAVDSANLKPCKIGRTKRAKVAQTLYNACIYLYDYGSKDVAVNVARQLIADAERRVKNGFGPVPAQDAGNLLEIENKYLTR